MFEKNKLLLKFVQFIDITIDKYKWEPGVGYPVLITNFISPWEFHLQLVNPENDIMEELWYVMAIVNPFLHAPE